MSNPRKAARPAAKLPEAGQVESPSANGQVEIVVNGVRTAIPQQLDTAVRRALEAASRPLPEEMTTTQAAEFLGVSRAAVLKLIKQGELDCRTVGKRRRIPSASLREYREKIFRRASRAADEMVRLAQKTGLYDLLPEPPPQT